MAGAVIAIAVGSTITWGVGLPIAVLCAGIAALIYAQTVSPDLRGGEFLTAGACFGLLGVGAAVGRAAVRAGAAKRRAVKRRSAEEAAFKRSAVVTAGTVTALRDTGATINDDPEAAITITYTTADGTAAQVEIVEVVPRLEVPRRGDPATVWYDPSTGRALAQLGGPQSLGPPTT